MQIRKHAALALALSGTLLGCGTLQAPPQTLRIEPLLSIRSAADDARGKYDLGRYYQAQSRLDEAALAYRQVLLQDPALYQAADRLGTIYASQGRFDQATASFNLALKLRPDAAHIHNNLGYAYLLQGRNSAALAKFDEALRLQPGNATARTNRELAHKRLATLAEPTEDSPKSALAARQVSLTEAQAFDGNIDAPVVSDQPAPLIAKARPGIEISNGNGATGMARQVSRFLQTKEVTVFRLSNDKPFARRTSSIEYRRGYENEARKLRDQLASDLPLLASDKLKRGTDLRLVLGRDASFAQAAIRIRKPILARSQELKRA